MRWQRDHGPWKQFNLCVCPGPLNGWLTFCEPEVVLSRNRSIIGTERVEFGLQDALGAQISKWQAGLVGRDSGGINRVE